MSLSNTAKTYANVFTLCFVAFLFSDQRSASAQSAGPDRPSMVAFLIEVVDLLEAKDTSALKERFYLPPDFEPEMFDVLLKRKVISRDGVSALEKGADYGSVATLYGEKRASGKVKDAGAPVDQCYAMKMEQADNNCEVIVHWTGTGYKIVDISRVGKMVSADVVLKELVAVADWPVGDAPSRELLLDSLAVLLNHIENGHYDEAKKRMYVPDDFSASKLKNIIERRELSAGGIEVMRKIGKYGPAAEALSKVQAESYAERVNVPIRECFAMVAVAESTGTTMAHWTGDQFKFLRADDIGKLDPAKIAFDQPAINKDELIMPETAEKVAAPPESTKAIAYETDPKKAALAHAALAASVEAAPKDVLLRIRYARNWLVIGNPLESWKQLRRALSEAQANSIPAREAIRGLNDTLKSMTDMGIFQVGVPEETIVTLLGEPDRKIGNQWVYPACKIQFADGRLAKMTPVSAPAPPIVSSPAQTPQPIVDVADPATIDLPAEWNRTSQTQAANKVTVYYHTDNENIDQHQQQVAVEKTTGSADPGSIKDIANSFTSSDSEFANAKSIRSHTLSSDEESTYFVSTVVSANGKASQHVTRLTKSSSDIYRFSLSVRTDSPLDPTEIEKWVSILKSGSFVRPESVPSVSEPSSTFNVVIKKFSSKVKAVRVIRELQPMSLKEAVAAVSSLPKAFKSGVSKEDAETLKSALEEAGMEVEIVPAAEK